MEAKNENQTKRRKRSTSEPGARYFLPKQDSSLEPPELGEEMPTEGEALVRSLKGDHIYFVVTAWKAVTQQNGSNPVIVKEKVGDKTT